MAERRRDDLGGGRAILKFAWILFRAGGDVGLEGFLIVNYQLTDGSIAGHWEGLQGAYRSSLVVSLS